MPRRRSAPLWRSCRALSVPPFRVRAVRDALGLVRLLIAVKRDGEDLGRPAARVDLGKELVLALNLGRCGARLARLPRWSESLRRGHGQARGDDLAE